MPGIPKASLRVFDPEDDLAVVYRQLPHWSQQGTLSFITWRTWDSFPKPVLQRLLVERGKWLAAHGIDPDADNWPVRVQSLDSASRTQFRKLISDRWNEQLDACHGTCHLSHTDLSGIVRDSLLHFDGDRYEITDFVVMPNHVHILVAFSDERSMLTQCDSWKHYTATQINRQLKRRGRFWQQDGFDHLVRSVEQFEMLRDYIADNPKRAKLRPGQFAHWSKQL
jgi:type I restriction enzyme R subunit